MRAVVYSHRGDPDVLTVIDRAATAPGAGEAQIRYHRSGVNPTDWKSRRDGGPVDPPQVPGQDGAGVVTAVGAGVDAGLVGQRVWVWDAAFRRSEGTAQEVGTVPVTQVVPLPDAASFDLGASLGIPFLTAHRCLTVTDGGPTRLGPGTLQDRVVLVAGGAGAVGNAAIQLARWSDATVISTVSSPAKAQLAVAAGADHVVNYRDDDAAEQIRRLAPRGVHTIVEVSAAQNARLDVAVAAHDAGVAIYADDGGSDLVVPIRPSMGPNIRWQFVLTYTMPHGAKRQAVTDVAAAVAAGALRVGADAGLALHHFPLAETAQAHTAVEGSIVGKVLIDITD